MTTKLRYQMTRDELIDEALLLHFQRFPVTPKEATPLINPRIDYLEKTFRPSPLQMPQLPLINPRIDYLEQMFRKRSEE
jgi:hypothetical protein